MLPNVIIAGPQKAGTTSLFRYLAAHPEVCHSSKKEIDFFLKYPDKADADATRKYESYFTHCSTSHQIRLEASPQYMMLGGKVAKRMHRLLPHIKLIFILREPVSALLSYIKFKPGVSTQRYSVGSFTSIIRDEKLNSIDTDGENEKINHSNRLNAGCYANKLLEFLRYYPVEQMGIFFYDELSADACSFMAKICNFIEIDGSFYENFQFRVENKTRSYRYPKFHRYVTRVNLKWEPFFNRHASIRNSIRRIYHFISETTGEEPNVSESDIQQLRGYYAPFNEQLYTLLHQNFPKLTLPSWLAQAKNQRPLAELEV